MAHGLLRIRWHTVCGVRETATSLWHSICSQHILTVWHDILALIGRGPQQNTRNKTPQTLTRKGNIMREIKIANRTYFCELLANGLILVQSRYFGLRCCLNSDGSIRHGDLKLTENERLTIVDYFVD